MINIIGRLYTSKFVYLPGKLITWQQCWAVKLWRIQVRNNYSVHLRYIEKHFRMHGMSYHSRITPVIQELNTEVVAQWWRLSRLGSEGSSKLYQFYQSGRLSNRYLLSLNKASLKWCSVLVHCFLILWMRYIGGRNCLAFIALFFQVIYMLM